MSTESPPKQADDNYTIRYNAIDPTRTVTKRDSFQKAFRKRWRDVRGRNREWVSDLSRPYDPRLQARYRNFFMNVVNGNVLVPTTEQQVDRGNHWTATYVRTAYQQGLELAREDLRSFDVAESIVQNATRITATAHRERLTQEYETVYYKSSDNVDYARNEVMDDVREAIQKDRAKSWLVDQTNATIRSGVQRRFNAQANTTIVRVVNEALLTAFEVAGVTEVGVAIENEASSRQNAHDHDHDARMRVNAAGEVEFVTAGDSRVCEICASLEGQRMKISDVRSAPQFMPPIHPNCRCRLVPTAMELKTEGETVDVPSGFTGGLRSDS